MKRTLFITLFLSIFSFNSTVSADVKVVTSIKPIHSLAAYVMDGVGKPNVIVAVSYTHLTLPTICSV